MIPLRSIAIFIFSLLWLFISVKQWGFDYPDISSMLFAIGFFLAGLYVAYDQLFKVGVIYGMSDDIKSIDLRTNKNEEDIRKLKLR